MKNIENIQKLLNKSKESFYWWGFIIADGSIDKNYNITLTSDIKDIKHITEYANYVNKKVHLKHGTGYYTKKPKTTCLVNLANKNLIKPFKENVLLWNGQKTYYPISLEYFKTENLIYFLLGLIDGDGCLYLTKNWKGKQVFKNCRIVMHENWIVFLEELSIILLNNYKIQTKVTKNKRNNSVMYIKDSECIKLTEYSKNIPRLERKWNKLDKN